MSVLQTINNSYDSYQQLISFYQKDKDKIFSEICVELKGFFATNMCTSLGVILDKFIRNGNIIDFKFDNLDIEIILQKNDFLTYYGKQRKIDTYHTTIKFQKLETNDGKFFKTYVIEELIGRSELPPVSVEVKNKIIEAIYEIFVNAQMHSGTVYIYTCGQFFPKKNKIEFTIVDSGIGFKEKVNKRFNSTLSAKKAIEWAIQDKKTTRKEISGGIGLAILKDFVEINKGKMQIISHDGFYQFGEKGVELKQFEGYFPGTIVNLQFKTDDNNNYSLKTKIDRNDIF